MSLKQIVVNKTAQALIPPLLKLLVGGAPSMTIKRIVGNVEGGDLKGEAKKKAVMDELKNYGYKIAKLLLNGAIELAVILVSIELGKLNLGEVAEANS